MTKFRSRIEQNKKEEVRVNELIKADPLRVIGAKGEQIGIVSRKEALAAAEKADLDLVEVSPKADPPVCKILDYGKYKYQQQKKAAEARKNQVVINVKEITIRPRTEEHDYQIKLRKMRSFLEKGDKVKVTLRFRGREMAHREFGLEVLQRIIADLTDIAKVDQHPKMEGRSMGIMLSSQIAKKN